jgi:hypothetical protein
MQEELLVTITVCTHLALMVTKDVLSLERGMAKDRGPPSKLLSCIQHSMARYIDVR